MVERAESRRKCKEVGDSDNIDIQLIRKASNQSRVPHRDLTIEEVSAGRVSVRIVETEQIDSGSRIHTTNLGYDLIHLIQSATHCQCRQ